MVHDENEAYKLIFMLDPFIFHYWTIGFPVANDDIDKYPFNFYS